MSSLRPGPLTRLSASSTRSLLMGSDMVPDMYSSPFGAFPGFFDPCVAFVSRLGQKRIFGRVQLFSIVTAREQMPIGVIGHGDA